jgi:hypothetical protein
MKVGGSGFFAFIERTTQKDNHKDVDKKEKIFNNIPITVYTPWGK